MKKEIDYFFFVLEIVFGLGFLGLAIVSFILGFKLNDALNIALSAVPQDVDVNLFFVNSLIAFFILSGLLNTFLGFLIVYKVIENLEKAIQERKNSVKYCPKCYSQNPKDSDFCNKCGFKFEK